ncbi:ribulose-bisphosphate carboxylase small chain [Streptomyces sp. Amel2xB2]|uniref:ribulose bisphosphate carboxylase small subunit n=1 Tax=Streptomyces sp. Amel2xB2 TaxID=1305829 RepID=UPI000DBA60A2|nr:ribulose bisphosphate carboxylase small subunit [Streptomyces sp. Amel2xB2]RAJ68781.1 ribulose-bisphosphate carboxylase small chain [Streptomyces sp. Amel2xB2]
MKFRHGTFSYLPDLTDEEIGAQVAYALSKGWPVSVEHTDDPHPRNVYWEMWGLPMFDLAEPDGVLAQIDECRATHPGRYVRVQAYDASLGRQSTALSFLVQRPAQEPGFVLERQEGSDRTQRYAVRPYATNRPAGARYEGG